MPSGSQLYDDLTERTLRSRMLTVVVACAFVVLTLRLVQVQILQAEQNIRLSKENRMQLRMLTPPRGLILDRNGEVLARNRPSYSICVLPSQVRDSSALADSLCRIRTREGLEVFERESLANALKRARRRRFDLTRLKEDVSMELVSIVEEHAADLPGIVVEVESRREYPLGPAAFHVLGYMSEIPEKDFDSLKERGYLYGDLVGKAGVERQYEDSLRGRNGQEYIEVNAYGKRMGTIENMPNRRPIPGLDVTITIDSRLQLAADEAFADTLRGAVVALDPRSGEVLAMLSQPSIDANIFSFASSLRSRSWVRIVRNPDRPLNNRATTGTYAPGSTFKLVSALAGLAADSITPTSHMPRPCTGAYRIGRMTKHCWYHKGHGYLTVAKAIQVSCNVYFYQLGLMLGDSIINHYADLVGLGHSTGIDLPSEASGWMSGEKLYNERHAGRGWKWTDGLLCDHAIGQTQNFTPLQLARMAATIANGGYLMRPHLLKEVRTHQGVVVHQEYAQLLATLDIDSADIAEVQHGMALVLQPGGTARRARVDSVTVGGKTGSAEWKKGELTHGLFVGAAPMENPEIAVAVVVEAAGHGGAVAAPIAGAVLNAYFNEVAPRGVVDTAAGSAEDWATGEDIF